jgi:hypothetical protein
LHTVIADLFKEALSRPDRAEPVRGRMDGHDAIDAAGLLARLGSGALRHPYFSVFRLDEETQNIPAVETRLIDSVTQSSDFADVAKVEQALRTGAFLKFKELGQWHRPTRLILDALARELSAVVSARAYLAQAEKSSMVCRTGGLTCIAQASGAAYVRFDAGSDSVAELAYGDLLVLTGGREVCVETRGESCQLLFQADFPGRHDYLIGLMAYAVSSNTELLSRYHTMSLAQRASAARDALAAAVAELPGEKLRGLSLSMMRKAIR